jgi:transcription elongation factor Elf1
MGGIGPVRRSQICPCCGAVLKLSEWSESVSEQQVARVWRCTSCGHRCETQEEGVTYEPSATELAEEFLQQLVVE